MKRWIRLSLLFFSIVALEGCFQTYNEDEDLRTIPITNNPYVVPSTGGGIPGIAG